MIVLLRSVTMQFRRLFWHISYYKVRQSNFITKCDRLLLQSVSGITKCDRLITKCARYYKVWQTLLQSVSGITKCDSYYKVRCNTSIYSIEISSPSHIGIINMSVKDRIIDSFQCVDTDKVPNLKKESICSVQFYCNIRNMVFPVQIFKIFNMSRYLTESVG